MSRRVCLDCPTIYDPHERGARAGRCPDCARQADRRRGTRTERGYGAEHQRTRTDWQRRIDAGEAVYCWRCGAPITGREWHLDHTSERDGYRGPACVVCNLHLAGKARHGLLD